MNDGGRTYPVAVSFSKRPLISTDQLLFSAITHTITHPFLTTVGRLTKDLKNHCMCVINYLELCDLYLLQ